ncbi:MAG: mannosyltransferase family protein [Anaerolineaceae bacterium]
MKNHMGIRTILFIWLGWILILFLYQSWVTRRIDLTQPDQVLMWTGAETADSHLASKFYLNDPYLNEHVAWDSEYYLAIAMSGYDDPLIQAIPGNFNWMTNKAFCTAGQDADCYSLSYAFFPFYPFLMRITALLFSFLPLTAIARFTLAGVVISLLGTLTAMLALFHMVRSSLGDDDGIRSAFFLVIFPGSFFLAQVYTEGLFVGLTFGALACLLDRKWYLAGLLAALAVWTRPGGALLFLPMALLWVLDRVWKKGWKVTLTSGAAVIAPLLSYGIWSLTPLAEKFHLVEDRYYGRGLLDIHLSRRVWDIALQSFTQDNLQTKFYYAIEITAVGLALASCIYLINKHPEISLYGLAMIFFALTSGSAQGMIRYMVVLPSLFWMLARLGRQPVFDRIWTLLSCLLMGLLALLFSFNYWVG